MDLDNEELKATRKLNLLEEVNIDKMRAELEDYKRREKEEEDALWDLARHESIGRSFDD